MKTFSSFCLTVVVITFVFSCIKDDIGYDFRKELVGTYALVCIKQQTSPPAGPGNSHPKDTSSLEFEVYIESDSDFNIEDQSGEIRVNGRKVNISENDLSFNGPNPPWYGMYHGHFYPIDSLSYGFSDFNSLGIWWTGCKGVKIN